MCLAVHMHILCIQIHTFVHYLCSLLCTCVSISYVIYQSILYIYRCDYTVWYYVREGSCICAQNALFHAKACLISAFWCGVKDCGNAILNSINRSPLWLVSPTTGIPSPTTFFLWPGLRWKMLSNNLNRIQWYLPDYFIHSNCDFPPVQCWYFNCSSSKCLDVKCYCIIVTMLVLIWDFSCPQ